MIFMIVMMASILALALIVYATVASSLPPRLPSVLMTIRPPPVLLSTINTTHITTDVRGNLGPPEVMLRGGTDWLKDRWQAASDMHGTAIQGHHQVLLAFKFVVQVDSIVLDWEAAYSKDYLLEAAMSDLVWYTLYDSDVSSSSSSSQNSDHHDGGTFLALVSTEETGESPGVNFKTPLHIIHTLAQQQQQQQQQGSRHQAPNVVPEKDPPKLQYLRLTIRKSAMGWGVSLWRVQVFGWRLAHLDNSSMSMQASLKG
jgi:hypothetical protein